MTNTPTPQQVLDLPMEENDSGADTVCGYLIALLAVIWDNSDDLSPFGNSGWKWDVYRALVVAGYAANPFDEDGHYVTLENDFDERAARDLIASAIEALDGGAAIEQTPPDGLGERLRRIAGQADEISKMARLVAENAALREQVAQLLAVQDLAAVETAPVEYIVIRQSIYGSLENCTHSYHQFGPRHPSAEKAVSHGWEHLGHDDFNLGHVQGDRLVWFGWMSDAIGETEEDFAEIARQLELVPDRKKETH